MRLALHLLLIVMAIWLPMGQALAACCYPQPDTHRTDSVGMEPQPCPEMQAHSLQPVMEPASDAEHQEENCAADCHHACHVGVAVASAMSLQVHPLRPWSWQALVIAGPYAHSQRLLRPPITPLA